MLKYFYIQSTHVVWVDLAKRLKSSGFAEPVVWLGSNPSNVFKNISSKCEIYDFFDQYYIPDLNVDVSNLSCRFLSSERYHYVKDICLKMMDREDIVGLVRGVDKESIFYYWLYWISFKVETLKPDFLLMSESPHSFIQYLAYELCEFASIKTFSFGMMTKFSPVMYLREGIYGNFIAFDKKPYNEDIDKILKDRARGALTAQANNPDSLGKLILSHQVYLHKRLTRFQGKAIYLVKEFVKSLLIKVPLKKTQEIFRKNRPVQVLSIEDIVFNRYNFPRSLVRRTQEKIWNELERAEKKYCSNCINNEYVYVSLHYEPERNSCPDGGEFYEQIKVISHIRNILPSNIIVLVKEHPSQTSRARIGYLGRSSFFYRLLSKIEGVKLVSHDISSNVLIEGAKFTVSLGGTMSLETALSGKKSVVFGNPWFVKAPNIISFSNKLKISDIVDSPSYNQHHVSEWILAFIETYGFPGVQNPSGEKYFLDMNVDNHFWESGLIAMEYLINKTVNSSDL